MQKTSGEEDRLGHNVGEGETGGKVEQIKIIWNDDKTAVIKPVDTLLPPGGSFPYWMVKYSHDGKKKCTFYHQNQVAALTITEKET